MWVAVRGHWGLGSQRSTTTILSQNQTQVIILRSKPFINWAITPPACPCSPVQTPLYLLLPASLLLFFCHLATSADIWLPNLREAKHLTGMSQDPSSLCVLHSHTRSALLHSVWPFKVFLRLYFFILYFLMCVCTCTWAQVSMATRRGNLIPWSWSYLVWVLGTKLESSTRATHLLNHSAMSVAHGQFFKMQDDLNDQSLVIC